MTMGDDDDDDDEEVMTTWPQRTCLFHARCASLSGINARANSNASGPRAYACKSRFVIEDRTWTICFTVSPSCATAWSDTCARRYRCGAPEVSPILLLLLAWRAAARPAPRRGSTCAGCLVPLRFARRPSLVNQLLQLQLHRTGGTSFVRPRSPWPWTLLS